MLAVPLQQAIAEALAHERDGRWGEAERLYRQILEQRPEMAEVCCNLGTAVQKQGRLDEAVECFQRAIALMPALAEAHYNLGNARAAQGRAAEAMAAYRQAVAVRADYVEAHGNLGNVLLGQGRLDEAIACYQRALALRPDYYEAHTNLGAAFKASNRFDEAIACYRKALALKPDAAETHSNLGNALMVQGRVEQALECQRRALTLKGGYAAGHSNLLLTMHYSPRYDAGAIFQEHLRWARQHAEPLRKHIRPHENGRDPERRLRVGYVSADFQQHSVAYFIEPVLANHDRGAFEITCYAETPRPDAVTRRLQGLADRWCSILGLPHARAWEQIRADGIDILVDLGAHTAGNRLVLFAGKPAPVQATYLGYPDTTGLGTMDYRITDVWADPPGLTERYCTEKLWRLPGGFLCYRPPEESPEVAGLPAAGRGAVTFGSFNNLAKVSPASVALWSKVLAAVPAARLLLKAASLGEPSTQRYVREAFARQGIPAGRIEMLGPKGSVAEHLKAYEQVDIALDTSPYNGATTTCEALWMGAPVVTLAGETHVSRVGLSLLTSAGLPELAATTAEEYVRVAEQLAQDRERLAAMRMGLRQRMRGSRLLDGARLTGELEAGYRAMWRAWCAGAGGRK